MRVLVLVLFAFLLAFPGCTGDQRYENLLKGFSTTQPAGWSAYEDELRVLFIPPAQDAQIGILAAYSKENASLQNLSESMKARLLQSPNKTTVLEESLAGISISGEPALEQTLVLNQTWGGAQKVLPSRFAYLKKAERYYIISLVFSPENTTGVQRQKEYEKAFETVLADFKLI